MIPLRAAKRDLRKSPLITTASYKNETNVIILKTPCILLKNVSTLKNASLKSTLSDLENVKRYQADTSYQNFLRCSFTSSTQPQPFDTDCQFSICWLPERGGGGHVTQKKRGGEPADLQNPVRPCGTGASQLTYYSGTINLLIY